MRPNKNPDWMTGKRERLSYYSFFMGQDAIYAMVTNFLITYLLFQGINPAKAATVMLAVKIWDAVNDALFGVIFDSVRFKSGKKFLPWLKIATCCIPITTALMYAIPAGMSETKKLVWFAVAYMLWDTAYTLCDVPIYGIVTAMTERIDERTSLLSYKSIWSGVGAAVTFLIGTVFVSEKVGLSFGAAAIAVSVFAAMTMIPVNLYTRERVAPMVQEQFTIRRMLRYLFGNKYLLLYYLGFLFYGGFGVAVSLIMLVSYYQFNNSLFSLLIGVLSMLPMLVSALFVPKILKRFDKMKVFRLCALSLVIVGVITWLFGRNSMVVFAVLAVVRSVPAAFIGVTQFMFTPDCAEYGIFRSGIEAKGITFAIQTFMAKLTGAVSSSMGLFLLRFFDWTPVEAESFQQLQELAVRQSDTAMNGLWFIYNMVPVIGIVLALAVWSRYKLRDKDVQVMADCNSGRITRAEALGLLSLKDNALV